MTERNGVLQLFTRAPHPGRVKTRLSPVLGRHGAAGFQETLIRRAAQLAARSGFAEVQMWTDDTAHPLLRELCGARGWPLHPQAGGDLGARMAGALRTGLAEHAFAVLMGTDCPSLTVADLNAAAGVLEAGADAVLAPAEDGGYVLIGVRVVRAELFAGIRWGGSRVAEATRARLRALGWRWHELAVQWDVDRPADLERFKGSRSSG